MSAVTAELKADRKSDPGADLGTNLGLTWFARHEIRLAWRDWLSMMTAGRRSRTRNVMIGLVVFLGLAHLFAYAVVGKYAALDADGDKTALVVVSGSLFLAWALMLSQAIESVTRVFYARADLDLIMSSPVEMATVFSVRMGAIALAVAAMALLFSTPFINVLILFGGARWAVAYAVVAATGISAAAVAIALTVLLFRMIGPTRTRLVAQIVAAIIGAGFVIVLQIAAIASYGTLSRFAVLTSDAVSSYLPDNASVFWWPAHAAFGDVSAALVLLSASLIMLGLCMAVFSPQLGNTVISAGNATVRTTVVPARAFRVLSQRRALWRKELLLLRRDPWLVSQTLMQLLYLLPPAFMLWRGFEDGTQSLIVLTPVIVMAAGQLAGGLAWLTISGEDAPDLVATAPVPRSRLIRAKIEVVIGLIAVGTAPFLLVLCWLAPVQAVVTAVATMIAAAASTAVQLWFRVQARRSHFRRRQTSSRVATFAEAFSSIGWAATATMALLFPLAAAICAIFTLGVLLAAWRISPARG